MNKPVKTRIAPSPTGFPHLGTIYQALIDKAYALKHKGSFMVRIEDTDMSRFVEGAEQKMYDALDWFNLVEDESPRKGGSFEPYKQSERLDIYKKYANQLVEKGYAYYCFCSAERLEQVRQEQTKNKKPPMYDKHCRNIPLSEAKKRVDAGESYVIRMVIPENTNIVVTDLVRGQIKYDSNTIDDQVILKSDGFPTYHLAHMVDDHLMNVTHVVRGHGWIPSSPKHKLLYDYFGWEMPLLLHTPDILNNEGKGKLSKRHAHSNVDYYKEQGFLPEAVLNYLALLGWAHPKEKDKFSFDEFVSLFDLKDLRSANPKFDLTKLEWLNGQYIKELSLDEFYTKVISFNPKFVNYEKQKFIKVLSLIHERVKKLIEVEDLVNYFYVTPTNSEEIKKLAVEESKLSLQETKEFIAKVYSVLKNISEWSAKNIDDQLNILMQELQIKPRQFFMPIRIVVSGRSATPHLGETLEMIGKEESLKRLYSFVSV